MSKSIAEISHILHERQCSCVIYSNETVTLCHKRGIADLFSLLKDSPETLSDAIVADKVIGKGAAALMILGGVKTVYADIISTPAIELFSTADITVTFGKSVPNIINRSGTGICPVEEICKECKSASECLPLIEQFVNNNH